MICKVLRAQIMGPPGSGKGTISKRIVKDFGLIHISSGDILRSHIRQKTDLGVAAKAYTDKGELVPDAPMLDLLSQELDNLTDQSWLLDGFPRTITQLEALTSQHKLDVVVSLDVPFDTIIDRIKGRWMHLPSGRIYHTDFNPPKVAGIDDVTKEPLVQRDDDKPETVKLRLEAYRHQMEPLMQLYRSQNLLAEFQGNYSNEIWPKVHKFLATKMKPLQYTEYK